MSGDLAGNCPVRELPSEAALFFATHDPCLAARLRDTLTEANLPVSEIFPEVLRVVCTHEQMHALSHRLAGGLSISDLDQIRCFVTAADASPSPAALMHSDSLRGLIASIDGQWLVQLLRSRRLVTYFQPIVRNSQPSEVYAYECLLRGLDHQGGIIYPDRLMAAARATGMLHSLDQAARLTAIRSAAESNLSTYVFVNFNPQFIDDPSHSLEATIRATAASGIDPSRFVFEVVESDQVSDLGRLLRILDFCREAGCRVALDDLGAGYNSLNLMAQVKPDFVKLDMDLIRNVDQDLYKSRVAAKLLELAQELDVASVAEGVETRGEWQWAAEHGADYSQGYLFARPDIVPPKSQLSVDASTSGPSSDLESNSSMALATC